MNISRLFCIRPIAFYPQLRQITGSIPAAIMLQQLLYWWDRRKGETIHKTEAEMQAETSLTPAEQKSAIKALKEKGFITVQRKGLPAKRHFIVHEDAINEALIALTSSAKSAELYRRNSPNCIGEIRRSNTENTAETTTENTAAAKEAADPGSVATPSKPSSERKGTDLADEVLGEIDIHELFDRLIRISGQRSNPSAGLHNLHSILAMLQEGFSLEDDIIPAAKEVARRKQMITTWSYLRPIAEDIRRKRLREKSKAPSGEIVEEWEWPYIAEYARLDKRWYWNDWGPPPWGKHLEHTLVPEKYRHLFDGLEGIEIWTRGKAVEERTPERYEYVIGLLRKVNDGPGSDT